jgi:hypothetical protein
LPSEGGILPSSQNYQVVLPTYLLEAVFFLILVKMTRMANAFSKLLSCSYIVCFGSMDADGQTSEG